MVQGMKKPEEAHIGVLEEEWGYSVAEEQGSGHIAAEERDFERMAVAERIAVVVAEEHIVVLDLVDIELGSWEQTALRACHL